MKLAEQIYRLRTKQNLSQTELADALQVSRQSVSKWETGQSVPDLDKLVRMAQLFQVSLDELVQGSEQQAASPSDSDTARELAALRAQLETQTAKRPARWYVGVILIGLGALLVLLSMFLAGAVLEGLILSAPFFVCGGLCLWLEKPGLWCAWNVFGFVWFYLSYGSILTMDRWWAAVQGYVPFDLAAWGGFVQLVVYLGLMAATVRRFMRRKTPTKPMVWALASAAGIGALSAAKNVAIQIDNQNLTTGKGTYSMWTAIIACKLGQLALLVVLCVLAGQAVYHYRAAQRNKKTESNP